ncbi:serine hydrolase domain-containing protein [Cupriavidus basilensis]|uniref:serine hydrolase domain-containing protein n=1 Tax=Cupriavidus basilensis TaxID=68895 RepID=UPI002351C8A9|nr:serine hydrolase domain-containing protein [Cupriavidus basilensis]
MRADVAQGRIPGAVYLIARNGSIVNTQTIGWQDAAGKVPMRPDSIFRIYSMSKPIVSVAVMMMVEDGCPSSGACALAWRRPTLPASPCWNWCPPSAR